MIMPGEWILAYAPACVDAATLILTDRGERRADSIRIGDTVITAFGRQQGVKWVGHRSFAQRFISGNRAMHPIRIEAGALGPKIPRNPLYVSPQLGFFLRGSLIPAWCLVNGKSVQTVRAAADVHYLQLELESHDIMLAEGAPAETYIDKGNRRAFHNADDYYLRYPQAPCVGSARVAPVFAGGPHVDLIRARLARRADRSPATR
jgi:hypothetical protein